MELYDEILWAFLKNRQACVVFPGIDLSAKEIIEMHSYQILKEIKTILNDKTLDDRTCLIKIKKSLSLLKRSGSDVKR